jgi:hypothetical protein
LSQDKNGNWECWPLEKSVRPAPIIVPSSWQYTTCNVTTVKLYNKSWPFLTSFCCFLFLFVWYSSFLENKFIPRIRQGYSVEIAKTPY